MFQKIKIVKNEQGQYMEYENNHKRMYRSLNDDEYQELFNKVRPNMDFPVAEKLVQQFVKSGEITPSFKAGLFFTQDDFNELLKPIKREFTHSQHQHLSGLKSIHTKRAKKKIRTPRKHKKLNRKLPRRTKRVKKQNARKRKEQAKARLLKKVASKMNKKMDKTVRKRNSTRKNKPGKS
jgi:hypothetical protein